MPKIVIVGESWGAEEEKAQTAFVGYSGSELTRMLDEAGIHRSECLLTNVFNIHPPGNKVEWFCGPKSESIPGYPAFIKGKFVHGSYATELQRLRLELEEAKPNVVIALGNTPMWAVLGKTAISKFRGTTEYSTHTAPGLKVLPTYHPAAVCRQWELRPTVVLDLIKARREAEFPEIRRPKVRVFIPETVEDLYEFEATYIRTFLSVDIETAGSQVTCIGFSPGPEISLVIPFYDSRRNGRSYWADADRERDAWGYIRRLLCDPKIKKLFQNGLYDISFLWRSYGIKTLGAEHDTLLLHHALQPEALKGLGFLGSIYTDHGAWKHMRQHMSTLKREE